MSRELTAALHDLMQQNPANIVPKPRDPRGSAPQVTAAAGMPAASGGGGGIASPLTEASVSAREYWPSINMWTSDGIFWSRVQPIKKIVMADANNNAVEMRYAQP
jgi:hypothetical protein